MMRETFTTVRTSSRPNLMLPLTSYITVSVEASDARAGLLFVAGRDTGIAWSGTCVGRGQEAGGGTIHDWAVKS
jgi:hypothetical protein